MKTEKNDSFSILFKVTLSNLILFLLFSAIAIVALSFIFFKFDDPKAYTSVISITTLVIASLISGIIQAKRLDGYNAAVAISFLSAIMIAFMFILSFFQSSGTATHGYLKYIIIPLAVAVGFILGKKRKSGKRLKIRKHK